MSLSRTYSFNAGISAGIFPIGDPVGCDNFQEALASKDDGKFVRYPVGPASSAYITKLLFIYDNLIPTGATLTAATTTLQYAKSYAASGGIGDMQISPVGPFGAIPGASLADPSVLTKDLELPTSENWATSTDVFTTLLGAPSQIPKWSLSVIAPQAPTPVYLSAAYLDYATITFTFEIPEPTINQEPTFFNVAPNNFFTRGVVTFGAGEVTADYPATVFFQWTEQDPDGPDFEEITIAQGLIKTTTPQVISEISADSRNRVVTAQVPSNFDPLHGTSLVADRTYWVRLVAVNDESTVFGPWADVQTAHSDEILSF